LRLRNNRLVREERGPQLRRRAIAIGNKLEVLKDYPAPKGCTSPFAPIWIAYILEHRK
jgi:3-methyladenine DNA glycosylase AlkD